MIGRIRMSRSRSTWTSHPVSVGLRVLGEVRGLGQDEPQARACAGREPLRRPDFSRGDAARSWP